MAWATQPTRRARVGIIFLTVFIDLVGFGIVIPVLPLYAREFGASETVNGLLVGIYSAMQFLFAPVLGKISDRIGRRPVLLVSLLGTAFGFFLMGVAPLLGAPLAWLFVARIIDGISGGNISTAQAYLADITAPEERSQAMGLIGAAFGLGFVFGPAIGGVMAHLSMAAPFYFAGGLALLNAGLVWRRLPESLAPEHRSQPDERVRTVEVLRHGTHLPALMAASFLNVTGFSIMTTNYALFTNTRFGFDAKQNAWIFVFVGLIGVVVQGGLLRPLLRRVSEKTLALAGMALLTAGLVWLPLVPSLAALVVATGLAGAGNSFVTPTLGGLASRAADRAWQGRVIGLMQSAGSLGRCVGPFAAGKLLALDAHHAWYGRTPFWIAAAVLVAALGCGLCLPTPSSAAGENAS